MQYMQIDTVLECFLLIKIVRYFKLMITILSLINVAEIFWVGTFYGLV